MIFAPYRYVRTAISLGLEERIFAEFPDSVEWAGNTLTKKDEYHVTICKGDEVYNAAQLNLPEGEEKLLAFFKTFVAERPIALQSFLSDFHYATDDARGRKTIIIRCTMRNLEEFFSALNKKFNIEMPTQPAHITLYALERNEGIHINNVEKMESLERVELPELSTALSKTQVKT